MRRKGELQAEAAVPGSRAPRTPSPSRSRALTTRPQSAPGARQKSGQYTAFQLSHR